MQRLTGAVESPGSSFAYTYDLAGNRTGVTVDGTAVLTDTYDAADQVVGWTYDAAGNLTNDGTTSYSYDATNDLTQTTTGAQTDAYAYNGDGTLVSQTANGTTTNYTQDLAADQSQILAATTGITTADYLYRQDTAPLAALTGGTLTWYGVDGQGSVRQSLDDSGNILGVANYDPFGQIEAGSSLIGPFGYTGELQDPTTGQEYLRARWYQPGDAQLLGVDPSVDTTGQPYSYADNDPVNGGDPSGMCTVAANGDSYPVLGLQPAIPCGSEAAPSIGETTAVTRQVASLISLMIDRSTGQTISHTRLGAGCGPDQVSDRSTLNRLDLSEQMPDGLPAMQALREDDFSSQAQVSVADTTILGTSPRIDYRPLTPGGCATGVVARLTAHDIGGSTNPSSTIRTIYYDDHRTRVPYDRGHLLGANIGGSNSDFRNFVNETANTNRSSFQKVENKVRTLLKLGFGVEYGAEPFYVGTQTASPHCLCTPSYLAVTIARTVGPLAPGLTDFVPIAGDQGLMCYAAAFRITNTTPSIKTSIPMQATTPTSRLNPACGPAL